MNLLQEIIWINILNIILLCLIVYYIIHFVLDLVCNTKQGKLPFNNVNLKNSTSPNMWCTFTCLGNLFLTCAFILSLALRFYEVWLLDLLGCNPRDCQDIFYSEVQICYFMLNNTCSLITLINFITDFLVILWEALDTLCLSLFICECGVTLKPPIKNHIYNKKPLILLVYK